VTEPIILADKLSRMYTLYTRPIDRLQEIVLGRSVHEDFWALREVSFQVHKGETIGIIGKNGSGKSTLLQLLAGVIQPTTGTVKVRGRVSALLELGAGFNPEFTGVENVILGGAIMGVTEAEMRARLPAIAAFAEIGDFIDKPVKIYSTGMYVRLAFATAINVDPDVLIVDEALAVGDAAFQHRCMLRFGELQASGVTIVLVTHDTAAVKRLCERVLWLDYGEVVDEGNPEHVTARYLASLFALPERDTAPAVTLPALTDETLSAPNVDRRFGDGAAEIVGVGVSSVDGQILANLTQGQPFVIQVRMLFHQPVSRPMAGFVFRDRIGTDLASTNTLMEDFVMPPAQAGEDVIVSFTCTPPVLHPGHYAISVTIASGDLAEYVMHDWIDNAMAIDLLGNLPIFTMMRFNVRCTMRSASRAAANVRADAPG
jgi:ABC-type polysaccharide/polyol phosphate transport system ATPase subunit